MVSNALMPLRKDPLYIADGPVFLWVPREWSGIPELGGQRDAPAPNGQHARDLRWQKPASSTADTSLRGECGRDGPERQPGGA